MKLIDHLVFFLLHSSVCFFTLSEVDNNFNKCTQFFLDDTPPDFTPPAGISVKYICQCLRGPNNNRIYLYATLYSTTWKIPIYSAYVFGSPNLGRCDAWYIEPQLDGDLEPYMRPIGYGKTIGKNQAVAGDYENSGYDKGHLYPVLHTNNHLSMLATSTLTNVAPQNPTFNQKAWLEHEKAVITDLTSCDDVPFVVTGVVPDTQKKLKNKVNVSHYYWRATCCLKGSQYIGKGYYGPDNNGKVQKLSIKDLQKMLNVFYNIKIFPSIPKLTKKYKAQLQQTCN